MMDLPSAAGAEWHARGWQWLGGEMAAEHSPWAESVENKKTRRQASMPSLGAIVFLPTCGAQDVAEFVVVLGSQ